MSKYANPNIPGHLHERMKQLANLNQRPIIREYEAALESWISQEAQDLILADSKLETMIMEKLNKTEKRLADLVARVGMDVAIVLISQLYSLNKETKIPEKELYDQFRSSAAKYFSRPLRSQNKEG